MQKHRIFVKLAGRLCPDPGVTIIFLDTLNIFEYIYEKHVSLINLILL